MRLILFALGLMAASSALAQEPPVLPEVATAYEAALAASVAPRRLIDEQRDWLARRDMNAVGEPNDIDRYRIAELQARTALDRAMKAASGFDARPGQCLGQALSACTSPIGGYLAGPTGEALIWQLQEGTLPDGQTPGHGLVVARPGISATGPAPLVWIFGQTRRLPPQWIEREGRRFLVLPARHDFLNDAEDVVFEWSDDNAALGQIDTWSWRDDLGERLPSGLTLPRNVAIDMAGLTARTPLWLGEGDTDEPAGGEATLRFILEGDRLALADVRVRDPLLELAVVTPAEVFDYAGRRFGCNHFAGEEAYDAERGAYIRDAVTRLRCDTLEADGIALERAHADRPDVLAAMARIEADSQ